MRVTNAKGKVLLTQQFDEINAICVDGLCSVQIADTKNALKEGKRYRWQVVAKVRGEKALVRTPKGRLTLQNPVFDSVMAVPPREITFTNFAANQVHVKDAAGSNLTGFPKAGTLPIWSLTGGELAYVNASAQIALYDFRTESGSTVGGSANAVIPQIKDTYWDPVWSPDGSKIAFVLSSDLAASSDRVDIFVMDADGNNIQNLTAGLATVVHVLPAWSPDGTQLAISASASGNDFDIFIINAATGSLVATVTDDNFPDGAPFWSVNGGKLAFLSPTNPDCLPFCVANADGSDVDTFNPLPPPTGNGDPLDWGAVWLPNGDYAFARLSAVPSLSSALYLNSGGSDQLLFNDAWFPKWRPSLDETLVLYGVEVANINSWKPNGSMTYLYELATGVEITAKELANYVNNRIPEQNTAAHAAFREVMLGDNDLRRVIYVREGTGDVCATDTATNPLQLELHVTCGTGNVFSQFTAVHELGHVLARVTYADFNTLINHPVPAGASQTGRTGLYDDGGFVFGSRGFSISAELALSGTVDQSKLSKAKEDEYGDVYYNVNDFQRGTRGWGSGIAATGPCGDVDEGQPVPLPTDFQQNPCKVVDYLIAITNFQRTTEVEETSGDMYLNWIYRLHVQTVPTTPSGFLNMDWDTAQCANGCQDTANPGDSRFEWMNCAMDVLWSKYQWFGTGLTLSNSCAAYGMNLSSPNQNQGELR